MPTIFITGISGTGKTTIAAELRKLGYATISLDEEPGLCHWYNKKIGAVVDYQATLNADFINAHEWRCDISKLEELLKSGNQTMFVLGMTENQEAFLDFFDTVLLLQCPVETCFKRIMGRKDNDFGKDPSAQQYIQETYEAFEKNMLSRGALSINAEADLSDVIQSILIKTKLQERYALVYCLESPVLEKVRSLEEKIFEITGSRICLDVWMPHLTIGSGIIVTPENKEATDRLFAELSAKQSSFEVTLKGFGYWESWKGAKANLVSPYVLFIKAELNEALLQLFNTVREATIKNYATYLSPIVEYTPHVTIAYSDLSKEGYEKGIEYLQSIDFNETIRISHLALVIETEGKATEYKRFNFGKL